MSECDRGRLPHPCCCPCAFAGPQQLAATRLEPLSTCGLLQDLLQKHMGMHLSQMRQFTALSQGERLSQSLEGSYLPVKGYYRIKTDSARQLQRQSWLSSSLRGLPSCFAMTPTTDQGHVGKAGKFSRGSAESDASTEASLDKPMVLELDALGMLPGSLPADSGAASRAGHALQAGLLPSAEAVPLPSG